MSGSESRLAVVETQISDHDRRIETLETSMGGLNQKVSDIDTNVKVVMAQLTDFKKTVGDSGKRNAWAIGIVLVAANILLDVALVFLGRL